MKMTKKYQFFAALVLVTSLSTNTMDKPKKAKQKKQIQEMVAPKPLRNWVIEVGNVILGKTPAQQIDNRIGKDKGFLELSPVDQSIIINATKTYVTTNQSLIATDSLRTLMRAEPHLDDFINGPLSCSQLIYDFSRRFKMNNASACEMLNLPCTLERLELQTAFSRYISNSPQKDISKFKEYLASGVDLYFTDFKNMTPAEWCVSLKKTEGLKMLLQAGVDPEYIGIDGLSLYNQAVQTGRFFPDEDWNTIASILEQAIAAKRQKKQVN